MQLSVVNNLGPPNYPGIAQELARGFNFVLCDVQGTTSRTVRDCRGHFFVNPQVGQSSGVFGHPGVVDLQSL